MLEDWEPQQHRAAFISKLVHIFVMSGFYICLNVANIYEY